MSEHGVNSTSTRTLFVGFGKAAQVAARALTGGGQPLGSIFVLTETDREITAAWLLGLPVEVVDPLVAAERHFRAPLTRIVIDLHDGADCERMVRIARACVPRAVIVATATDPHSVSRLLESGASQAFCASSIAGHLLAETVVSFPVIDNPKLH